MRPRAIVRGSSPGIDRVVNVSEARLLESGAGPNSELMQRAGASLSVAVRRQLGPLRGRSVITLVGPGNNGGDALIMAKALAHAGGAITCWGSRERIGDPLVQSARRNGVRWRVWSGNKARPFDRDIRSAIAVVDGLLGVGSTPPLRGAVIEMLHALPPVVDQHRIAIDVPTGVDPDTGHSDAHAFQATSTLATGPIKFGTILHPGIEYAGIVEALDIGFSDQIAMSEFPRLLSSRTIRNLVPTRPLNGHKGSFGKLLIIGGSTRYHGAPALASLAAQAAGAGLVTVASIDPVIKTVANLVPAATFYPLPSNGNGCIDTAPTDIELTGTVQALLVGPGLGRSQSSDALVLHLLTDSEINVPIVIDADGLNVLADNPTYLDQLRPNHVLTPHPGELARLLAIDNSPKGAEVIEAARTLAIRTGALVVAKGSPTFVTTATETHVLAQPNPALATAGSGDILAGTIASLAAQKLPVLDAARLGVWMHSQAGMLAAGQRAAGLAVEDIARHISEARLDAGNCDS